MRFTSENAREMAARSNAVQRERRRNPPPAFSAGQAPRDAEHVSAYALRRLTRVRRQLDRLDKLMWEETDPPTSGPVGECPV